MHHFEVVEEEFLNVITIRNENKFVVDEWNYKYRCRKDKSNIFSKIRYEFFALLLSLSH